MTTLILTVCHQRCHWIKCEICFLFVYMNSITNLKYWGGSEPIISKTLQLLNELSVGYSSVRKLVKLEAVQFMLANHTVSLGQTEKAPPFCWNQLNAVKECHRTVYIVG